MGSGPPLCLGVDFLYRAVFIPSQFFCDLVEWRRWTNMTDTKPGDSSQLQQRMDDSTTTTMVAMSPLVMLSIKSLVSSNVRKHVMKGMKALVDLLAQDNDTASSHNAKAAVEAGLVEEIVAAMDKPFPVNKMSKLQSSGWDILSSIHQSCYSDQVCYRERIINSAISLTAQLRVEYQDAHMVFQRKIDTRIRCSRSRASSSSFRKYREMREGLHRTTRLLLYRNRRHQDRMEMQEKVGPSYRVKLCTGGFHVSYKKSKHDNDESSEEVDEDEFSDDIMDYNNNANAETHQEDGVSNNDNVMDVPASHNEAMNESSDSESEEESVHDDNDKKNQGGSSLWAFMKTGAVFREDDFADSITLGPTLRKAYEGMFSFKLQREVRILVRRIKCKAAKLPDLQKGACQNPGDFASKNPRSFVDRDHFEYEMMMMEYNVGPCFKVERCAGGFRVLYR